MVTRETFIFYIINTNKRALYVDENGFIKESDENFYKANGQPAHLTYSPDGWKETTVQYARNVRYWGLVRDMTIPMKFPRDGFEIIKNALWSEGVEKILYMSIAKFDSLNLPYRYAKWYMTELNLPKFEQGVSSIKVDALEGGPSKWIKANENVEYEIPVKSVNVLMDGLNFGLSRTFGIMDGQAITGTENYYLGAIEIAREGEAPTVMFQDVLSTTDSPYPNNDWIIQTGIPRTIKIKGKVSVYWNKSVSAIIRTEESTASGGGFPQTNLINEFRVAGTSDTIDFEQEIPMSANSRINLKVFGGSPSDSTPQFTITGGEFTIEYIYKHKATYCKAEHLYDIFLALVSKVTEGNYTGESLWLSKKKDIVYTCGNALRGLENSAIKISLAKFFQSLPFAGLGVKGSKIIIEQLDYFFNDSSMIVDLGEVSDAKITFAEDLVGNSIKAGYGKYDYNDVNGKYEFNQGQVWSAPMTKVVKELDFTCPVRADALGAELMRMNLDNKKTTDNESDNDPFMLNIETIRRTVDGVDYFKLYRPAYSSVTGLPYWETYFNTELSPHKRLLKSGRLLRSLFDFSDLKEFKLTSKDKNVDLVTTLDGVTVSESLPIQIGSLGEKLFLPYYLSFVTKVPVNLLELINTNQYGYIKFTWKKRQWYGFLMDGKIKPDDRDKQTWKLISSTRNDLSKF